MNSKTKKRTFRNTILGLLFVLGVSVLALHLVAANQVSKFLDRKLPAHIKLSYSEIDVNLLKGQIHLEEVTMGFFNRDSAIRHTDVKMQDLTLTGLSYWQFLTKNTIGAEELNLNKPEVNYYSQRRVNPEDKESKGVVNLLKTIQLEELSVVDGQFIMFKKGQDSLQVKAPKINISIYNLHTDSERIKQKIPLTYGNYDFESSEIFVDLGPYEKLEVGQFEMNDKKVKIGSLSLVSKYDRQALSKVIPTERDYVDLRIPEVTFKSIDFGFNKNRFFVSSESGMIQSPKLASYRDKLVADNVEKQKLYGTLLRNLPISLSIDEIEVVNGNVVYEELTKRGHEAGRISFDQLNVLAQNISNTYKVGGKTHIKVESKFMNSAPMKLEWSFDTTNERDVIIASGSVTNFDATNMDQFLSNNLGVNAKGKINALYFTINADNRSSTGDIKMKYRDFKFAVLKKNRLGVNKLLSAIGNLFVNDGSDTDTDGFRHGKIEVERDPTKSFFNYLWINVRDGIGSTLTGDGKKVKE